jgi:methionyl aminopeptidase
MQGGNIEDWRKAGKIAAEALSYGKKLIVSGERAVEILDKIEAKIHELGGEIAFPAQMSFNDTAAHWCADPGDSYVLKDELVCLDVGVHVNGCIGDNACTVDLSGKWDFLVKASRDALNAAIAIIKPGITVHEVGEVIKNTIVKQGFLPVHNLSGHGLGEYKVHCFPSMSNYGSGDMTKLEDGQIVAIEPFATNGAGMIQEIETANLFAFVQKKPVRSQFARDALKIIQTYKGLPFTTRWLTKKMPIVKVNYALRELIQAGVIRKYPPLVEVQHGMVSQAEHTIRVGDNVEILTR